MSPNMPEPLFEEAIDAWADARQVVISDSRVSGGAARIDAAS